MDQNYAYVAKCTQATKHLADQGHVPIYMQAYIQYMVGGSGHDFQFMASLCKISTVSLLGVFKDCREALLYGFGCHTYDLSWSGKELYKVVPARSKNNTKKMIMGKILMGCIFLGRSQIT